MYPLGLEPKLDGVGGRNVIQLHYEYVRLLDFLSLSITKRLKKKPFCGIICVESTSILLFLRQESKRFRLVNVIFKRIF